MKGWPPSVLTRRPCKVHTSGLLVIVSPVTTNAMQAASFSHLDLRHPYVHGTDRPVQGGSVGFVLIILPSFLEKTVFFVFLQIVGCTLQKDTAEKR